MSITWRALAVGVEVTSHSAEDAAELAVRASRGGSIELAQMQELATLMRAHSLLVFRGSGEGHLMAPAKLREL